MAEFDDEIEPGLPPVKVDLRDRLWNVGARSEKRYVKTWSIQVDSDMYQVLQAMVNHPALPFMGNGSAMGRHFLAAGIRSLEAYLDPDLQTTWRRLLNTQRRLTNEWYVLKIDEHLDMQVESLREWTLSGEWEAVVKDLRLAMGDMAAYERPEFKRRVAQAWLRHKGVKQLLAAWEVRMKDESPQSWAQVVEVFGVFEEVGRV